MATVSMVASPKAIGNYRNHDLPNAPTPDRTFPRAPVGPRSGPPCRVRQYDNRAPEAYLLTR
jgi:hypothetical protein